MDLSPEEQEEINIAYVACTRAQNSLMVINFNVFMALINDILIEDTEYFSTPNLF